MNMPSDFAAPGELTKIFAALIAFQAELEAAPKESFNPHFKNRYADLATCVAVARPVLAKHKLGVFQTNLLDFEKGLVGVRTVLIHESGESIVGDIWCQPRSLNAQDVGAATTYLRRYGYSSMLGLVTEEDDDGNTATGANNGNGNQGRQGQGQAAPKTQTAPKANPAQPQAAAHTNAAPDKNDEFLKIINDSYRNDQSAHKIALNAVFKTLKVADVPTMKKAILWLEFSKVTIGDLEPALVHWLEKTARGTQEYRA
jgi:hypothetical protein